MARLPQLRERIRDFHARHPELADQIAALRTPGVYDRRLLAVLDEPRLRRVLDRMLDGMFGGNSNWRGPVWFPINLLVIRSLLDYYAYYGDEFRVECPTGSGQLPTLFEVAQELSRRLVSIALKDEDGRRPVFGGAERFQTDPNWQDDLLFYEYFHGDNGAGLGASHQTGWTGAVARLIQAFGYLEGDQVLNGTPVRAWYVPTSDEELQEEAGT